MSTTILDTGVAEKLELSLCVPLHCCRLVCLHGPLQRHGSFRFMWPLFTYIGSFTISPFVFVRPSSGGSKVVYADSATD